MRLRIGAAQLNMVVGDLEGNVTRIIGASEQARDAGCDLVCFPELAVCGYPPEDLLLKPAFVAETEETVAKIAASIPRDIVAIVGTVHHSGDLYNAVAVCADGRVAADYHKRHLPNYGVFDEKRYFASGRDAGPLLRCKGVTFGVTICEDVWMPDGPLLDQARAGAQLAINVNGSPYHRGKLEWRRSMLATRASDSAVPFVFVNLVGGQDELVFDGASMLFGPDGDLVASAPQFVETVAVWDVDCSDTFRRRLRDTWPRSWRPLELPIVGLDPPIDGGEVVPIDGPHPGAVEQSRLHTARPLPPLAEDAMAPAVELGESEEVYRAIVLGVGDYLTKNGFSTAVIGLSGGIDSALTAAIAVDAIGAGSVTGIAMPSQYSSEGSIEDARSLADNLGIRFETLPISDAFTAILDTLEPVFQGTESGIAEENVQSRIRGNLLMAFSNKFGALLLSTGNKSEMATGYATLYGDMAGGYAVLKDVPKTLVYELARWRNALAGTDLIPQETIDKPPSAELRPDQRDTDSLPPYEVLDPIIEAYVEHDMVGSEIVAAGIGEAEAVEMVVGLIELSEYKRRQSPPGVRITPKAFGRDRRLPLTNRFRRR